MKPIEQRPSGHWFEQIVDLMERYTSAPKFEQFVKERVTFVKAARKVPHGSMVVASHIELLLWYFECAIADELNDRVHVDGDYMRPKKGEEVKFGIRDDIPDEEQGEEVMRCSEDGELELGKRFEQTSMENVFDEEEEELEEDESEDE